MAEIKLKPCPFCGGKVKTECIDDEYYYISCEICCSSTSFGYVFDDGTARDATKAETITAWNRRADKPETDFISRKAIYDAVNDIGGCDATDECAKGYDAAIDAAIDVLQNIPAADVEPVRHGRWKKSKGNERPTENGFVHDDRYVCDCCGWGCCCETKLDFSYCPNCGAKMDGDTNAR